MIIISLSHYYGGFWAQSSFYSCFCLLRFADLHSHTSLLKVHYSIFNQIEVWAVRLFCCRFAVVLENVAVSHDQILIHLSLLDRWLDIWRWNTLVYKGVHCRLNDWKALWLQNKPNSSAFHYFCMLQCTLWPNIFTLDCSVPKVL